MANGITPITPKIARAKQHIDDLDAALSTFHNGGKRRPCGLTMKGYTNSAKSGKCIVYEVTFLADIPIAIPLLIGDAIQNLRSSLDYLAHELVLAGGNTPTKQTSFPIFETAQKYIADSPRKVAGMRKEVIDKIAALKPYQGGNEPLWRLHALNNIDKHRLLLTCMATASARYSTGEEDGIPTFTTEFFKVPLTKGKQFALPMSENQDNAEIRSEITFNEPGIIDGESVTAVLNEIMDVVANLVSSFEPFLI